MQMTPFELIEQRRRDLETLAELKSKLATGRNDREIYRYGMKDTEPIYLSEEGKREIQRQIDQLEASLNPTNNGYSLTPEQRIAQEDREEQERIIKARKAEELDREFHNKKSDAIERVRQRFYSLNPLFRLANKAAGKRFLTSVENYYPLNDLLAAEKVPEKEFEEQVKRGGLH